MMLCVPRSVSPIDVRQAAAKGPPSTPARPKLFTRNKESPASSPTKNLKPPLPPVSTTSAGSSNTSASSVSAGSSTACSDATTVTEDGGISHSPGPTTPVSVSKRTGSKWLASLRSPSIKQRPSAKDVVAVAELATSAQALETGIISPASGTTTLSPSTGRTRTLNNKEAQGKPGNVAATDSSETSNVSPIGGSPGGKTLSSFLGSLTKRPKELPVDAAATATAKSSRPTPSPLPLQPRDMAPIDLQSESEEDEDESDDEDDDFADVSLDVYPTSQPSAQPSLPSIFYPSSSSNHSHHHHHHLHHGRPSSTAFQIPDGPRKPQGPLRSHINLLQLTTSSLQPSPTPHPLITTPRSASANGGAGGGGGGNAGSANSANGALLFPRSCNPNRQLPPSRSVLATLHKTRVICRLESPGSLTAAEELSIMPFATRLPGSSHRGANGGGDRSSSNPANAMYPSSSYRSSSRSSLMRNLALEDGGDLIREVDVNATGGGGSGVQGNNHYPTFSKGLKRWLARPPFEQRMAVWTPASATYGADSIGLVRSAVHRPALMGPAALEFSQGVEALAGVVRPRRLAWLVGGARSRTSVSQVVPTLVIPPPPLLSSSPSSTTSIDTIPNTPGSNDSSSQNLTSFVPPAFLRRLRQNQIAYVDPNISDEDDVPLGVVVIKKHSDDRDKPVSSPSRNDPQEKARRQMEKEKEKEKRKLKEAERKKAFKEQVSASRIRREAHRSGGRYGPTSLSQDWIEVDAAPSPSPPISTTDGRGSSSAPGGTSHAKRSATIPAPQVPTNSSGTSIRSQSSARSRARPPSVVDSERSYQSARTQQTQSTQHHPHRQSSGSMGMMPMMTAPIMVYNAPYAAVGNGNGNGANLALPAPPYPPQFFAPPPPPLPVTSSTTRSTKSSNGSRRDSGYGEFGQKQQQQQEQQQQQKSASFTGQQFWTLPSRRSSKSDVEKMTAANTIANSRRSSSASQHGLVPPRPRFASNTSNESSSDNGGNNSSSSRRSGHSGTYSASRRSSMLIPPVPLAGRNIN
ncbi:hypothetical protein FRC04_008853 [Tulasnella sp. 424]|nr:hypothetical protein FRC04_008853 [Tulasnella sp. 424]KAG8973755.1 hypothetical protein FRC05_008174 [Tulasnella sp. 425]